jgi:hypothetical protein
MMPNEPQRKQKRLKNNKSLRRGGVAGVLAKRIPVFCCKKIGAAERCGSAHGTGMHIRAKAANTGANKAMRRLQRRA